MIFTVDRRLNACLDQMMLSPNQSSVRPLVFVTVTIISLIMFCYPWRRHPTGGSPRNLWTSGHHHWDLNWSAPSVSIDVLEWDRTAYGILWSYLVVDRGIGHPAWYARFDPRVLIVYVVGAFVIGGVAAFLFRGTNKHDRA